MPDSAYTSGMSFDTTEHAEPDSVVEVRNMGGARKHASGGHRARKYCPISSTEQGIVPVFDELDLAELENCDRITDSSSWAPEWFKVKVGFSLKWSAPDWLRRTVLASYWQCEQTKSMIQIQLIMWLFFAAFYRVQLKLVTAFVLLTLPFSSALSWAMGWVFPFYPHRLQPEWIYFLSSLAGVVYFLIRYEQPLFRSLNGYEHRFRTWLKGIGRLLYLIEMGSLIWHMIH